MGYTPLLCSIKKTEFFKSRGGKFGVILNTRSRTHLESFRSVSKRFLDQLGILNIPKKTHHFSEWCVFLYVQICFVFIRNYLLDHDLDELSISLHLTSEHSDESFQRLSDLASLEGVISSCRLLETG